MRLETPKPGDSLGVVLKLPGETCNINCHYCYEKRKPYPGSSSLDPDTLHRFLELLGDRPLSVMLHGGEPLLVGRERIRSLLYVLRERSAPTSLSIQTNGTLLSDRWIDFFEENCPSIELGLSLDGDVEGNAHRVDYRGKPTFDQVVQSLKLLERRGWTCGVIVVVTRKLLGRHEQVIEELMKHPAIKNVKLSPCLDFNVTSKNHRGITGQQIKLLNSGQDLPGWATTPGEYAEFLRGSFRSWRAARGFDRFLLEPFVSIARAARGKVTNFTHFDYRKDPFIVTLYPDGRIGSCDELDMPDGLLGHVDDGISVDQLLARADGGELFGRLISLTQACEGCRVNEICRGGSLPDRLRYAAGGQSAEYCQARVDLIDSTIELMSANGGRQ
ncbi:radical SAM protein [Kitasatospora kifunensis]|uniref:Radical SAM core domain-containing protein n=1 Tax=Kitasatospora kifunensis TaxID=58351 RepID=A0A7W7VYR1_KITKI|nr:radical SAM protein [Kitasatospora kifunensis]MBB4926925.1 uncharacterized protein [Kitasatospora kifunensis]